MTLRRALIAVAISLLAACAVNSQVAPRGPYRNETYEMRQTRWRAWRGAHRNIDAEIAAFLSTAERSAEIAPFSIWDRAEAPEMVIAPTGTFTMGSSEAEMSRSTNERPMHVVTIAHPFAVGRFEVTRGEFAIFSRAANRVIETNCVTDRAAPGSGPPNTVNAANFGRDPQGSWADPAFAQTDDHPVVCVSWNDAQAYVAWLSQITGKHYRLLTEAEWEYVARAGAATPYWWGSSATHDNANYGAETCCSGLAAGSDNWVNTSPVGSFGSNAFGLFDTSGNVWEWVQDCYGPYSEGRNTAAASEPDANCERVIRGGSWVNYPLYIRPAVRGWINSNFRDSYLGFRVARDL